MPGTFRKLLAATVVSLASCLAPAVCSNASGADKPPEQEVRGPTPMLESNIDRSLRYFPQGSDFVITNGAEYFNRPLYVNNSGFRIDGGDRPEFSLYLPGRGGNLRFGLRSGKTAEWLDQREQIVARYRPGSLIYDFPSDAGNLLRITALPSDGSSGLIVRVEPGPALSTNSEFIVAFGGVNGMRGRRNGDIGCENLPVGQFFQLRPEQCRDDRITPGPSRFITKGRPGAIAGYLPGAFAEIGNANEWKTLGRLVDSASTNAAGFSNRVAILRLPVGSKDPFHLLLEQVKTNATWDSQFNHTTEPELAMVFAAAENRRREIAGRVVIETPDPFINAAAPALNVAADAIWDEAQQSFMHGAVAWRSRLLGWRGMYSGDALGWHERTRKHFEGFAKQQNTTAIPEDLPSADESANLSRNEAALHSNGDMTKSHYDMNLVAVDAFFRHLLWTGDLDFARRMWPVIERHLAWERRLFRREFGPDKLPLYEGYAAIWASDDLAYNGGGSAHGSAYNFYHNRMAARVAKLIGKDATPYEREAELIAKAMRKYLWVGDQGNFAEWKDLLGEQRVHSNAAVWTFYHTIDSEVPTPMEAWQMSRFVDSHIVRIPVRGPNVPPGNFTIPTTSWMPYTWSLNNVVMAESMHTALAYWQAIRTDAAFPLFKGALLDSMYLGLCPGNVGATTFYDANRRETQRDFADGVGATSRALIEGLFGIKPDALAGELKICPGFPVSWDHASIRHPDFEFSFKRDGDRETYAITSRFPKPMKLRLQVPALRTEVKSVTVNGKATPWIALENPIGQPRIEVQADATVTQQIVLEWKGEKVSSTSEAGAPLRSGQREWATADEKRSESSGLSSGFDWKTKPPPNVQFEPIDLIPYFNDRVTQIFRNEYLAPRSPFCSLATPKQGIGSWCHPNDGFAVDDSGLRATAARAGGKIVLPNGVPLATPEAPGAKNVLFTSQWTNYPTTATIPLSG
ncbi:MAG TPA: DUF4450 domain-containing protein, partial [Candidatus Paceibacterota bacterium]|nr:DUF4450 domain-containing protein [Candidatus Paceibacterota bacterium]